KCASACRIEQIFAARGLTIRCRRGISCVSGCKRLQKLSPSHDGYIPAQARSKHSMRLIRRFVGLLATVIVALFPLLLVASSIALVNGSPAPSVPTLRQLAAGLGIHVGSAVDYTALTSDAQYAHILGQQFSAITPENEMKWVSVEAQQGVYTFDQADAEVQFAQQHHQLVRGHNLV